MHCATLTSLLLLACVTPSRGVVAPPRLVVAADPEPVRAPNLASTAVDHHVSLDALADGDGPRLGRRLVHSESPIQLPRIVAYDEGWSLSWSGPEGTSPLEVNVAALDASLAERTRVAASPRDGHGSSFAFAAPAGDAWGVVFLDDRDGVRGRAAWFARADRGERAVTRTWRVPIEHLGVDRAGHATVAWSPVLRRWGVLASANGGVVFLQVDPSGALISAQPMGSGTLYTLGDPTLIWAEDRWAFLALRDAELRLTTVRGDRVLAEVPVFRGFARDAALDWDGRGFGVAWSADGAGVAYVRLVDGRPVHPTRVVSNARFATQPCLAWNGRDHVLAWSDQPDATPNVRVARFDRDGVARGERLVAEGSPGREAWFPSMSANGSDVALVWQEGQGDAWAMVLTP
jgi:hypothetical protein